MEGGTKHWGENPQSRGESKEAIPIDMRNYLILKAMKPDPLKLHQPYKQEEDKFVVVPPECTTMDSVVLHTVQLLQYGRTLRDLIKLARQQTEQNTEIDFEGLQALPVAPPFPEQPERPQSCSINHPFRYVEKKFSAFSEGQGMPPPRLNAHIAKKILRKAVAVILAHIGFESTSEEILDILADVTEEYIQKFTRLLRVAVDQEAMSGSTGFPDAVERVCYEMGIGSVRSLHDFYQIRVLKYHQNVLNTCKELQEEYANLSLPILKAATESEIIRCATTETDNEEDIPEIHFPALGEGYSADELQPSLEPGFQMLHSLEQEEQLQNLEPEEEINVSDSPSQDLNVHGTTVEPSQQTPSSGKTRKKKKKGNASSSPY